MTRPICRNCDEPCDRVIACEGRDCQIQCGPCCLGPTSLCPPCEKSEQQERDARLTQSAAQRDTLIAILLSHATIGGQRLPSITSAAQADAIRGRVGS